LEAPAAGEQRLDAGGALLEIAHVDRAGDLRVELEHPVLVGEDADPGAPLDARPGPDVGEARRRAKLGARGQGPDHPAIDVAAEDELGLAPHVPVAREGVAAPARDPDEGRHRDLERVEIAAVEREPAPEADVAEARG